MRRSDVVGTADGHDLTREVNLNSTVHAQRISTEFTFNESRKQRDHDSGLMTKYDCRKSMEGI